MLVFALLSAGVNAQTLEIPSNGFPLIKHLGVAGVADDVSATVVPATLAACLDPAQSVTVTVTRPDTMTEMRGEWIGVYEKDTWSRIAYAREATEVNTFGTLLPTDASGVQPTFLDTTLDVEFTIGVAPGGSDPACVRRPQAELDALTPPGPGSDDVDPCNKIQPEFWEDGKAYPAGGRGEYEFRYASPHSLNNDKWIAHEFPFVVLRVGNPFDSFVAGCDPATRALSTTPSATFDTGVIVPAYYGHPIEKRGSYNTLQGAIDTNLAGLADPNVIVMLNIYYEGMDFSYVAAEEAEWQAIVADLVAAGVKVVGTVDKSADKSATILKYKTLLGNDLSGIAFKDAGVVSDTQADLDSFTAATTSVLGADALSVFIACTTPPDTTALGTPDVWVSVCADDIGRYMPYAQFSEYHPLKSAAILTGTPQNTIATTDANREHYGYGYFFYTELSGDQGSDVTGYQYPPTYINELMEFLKTVHDGRRLQEGKGRSLTSAVDFESIFGPQTSPDPNGRYLYACDDLKFECKPRCMLEKGVRRTFVPDSFCEGQAEMDTCACDCFYDVKFLCEDGVQKCYAKAKGFEGYVGDKVCLDRDTPKFQECTMESVAKRDGEIDESCVEAWKAPEVTVATTTTETPTTTEAPVLVEKTTTEEPVISVVDPTPSFAPAMGLAALLSLFF